MRKTIRTCLECCRQNFLGNMADFRNFYYPCACAAETCYAVCGGANDTCNVTTITPSLGCFHCMADAIQAGAAGCRESATDCAASPDCTPYSDCTFKTCFGLF